MCQGLDCRGTADDFQSIELLADGHAAGLIALHAACARLRAELVDICVIAGFDSYLTLETLEWLDRNRQLADLRIIAVPSFLERRPELLRLRANLRSSVAAVKSLAVVRGIGLALETNRIKTNSVCLGEGLTESVKIAVASIRPPEEIVDGIICDINGERYRTEEWAFAFCAYRKHSPINRLQRPASFWGDVGAAMVPSLWCWRHWPASVAGAKGSRYLVWNSSESGRRAAALLQLAPVTGGGAS